jgi:chemotaxis signal transduction protein
VNAQLVDSGRSVREDGLVCCAVGDKQYALRGADVRQIVRVEKMRAAAGSDGRAGTLDVAGQSVPVFRLGSVLGRGAQRSSQSAGYHIAVTGERGELVGWLVDRIVRTPLSQDAQVVSLPALVGPIATTWFEALVRLGSSSVLLIAPQYLNPLAARPARSEVTRAFSASAREKRADSAERVVLLFSTPALPPCAAARFALSGRRIAAITQPMQAIAVPGCAPHVMGVAWWRNAVVPVVDFRGPGHHDDVAQRRRYVIAQCGARLGSTLVAFPVDSEIVMHRPDVGDRRATGAPCPPFVAGMFDVGGESVALLDLDALLALEQSGAVAIPA